MPTTLERRRRRRRRRKSQIRRVGCSIVRREGGKKIVFTHTHTPQSVFTLATSLAPELGSLEDSILCLESEPMRAPNFHASSANSDSLCDHGGSPLPYQVDGWMFITDVDLSQWMNEETRYCRIRRDLFCWFWETWIQKKKKLVKKDPWKILS